MGEQMTVQTIKCNICGRAYKFYAYLVGDQSACPKCREEAKKSENISDSEIKKWCFKVGI